MMFENIEELLKETPCIIKSGNLERTLFWWGQDKHWAVTERKRYAKKTHVLYQGDDIREAMQLMK